VTSEESLLGRAGGGFASTSLFPLEADESGPA
jgi:hypothetical protein